jgi:signal transduction histidine kinase
VQVLARADGAAILLRGREIAQFVPDEPYKAVGLDEHWLQRHGLDVVSRLARRAMETGTIVDVRDTASTRDWRSQVLDLPLLSSGQRPRAIAVVPLHLEGTAIGVLELFHAQPRTAHLDREALVAFAEVAVLAITSTSAHERGRRHDQETGAAHARLRQVVDVLPEGIIITDAEGRFLISNAATTAIFGADLTGRAMPLADRDAYEIYGVRRPDGTPYRSRELPLQRSVLGGVVVRGEQVRVRNEVTGEDTPLLMNSAPLHDETGTVIGGVAIFQDITLLQELERARADVAMLRERERISRDLHDGVVQEIYAATLQLSVLAEDLRMVGAEAQVMKITEQLSRAIGDLRAYIRGLRAQELDGQTVNAGLAVLVRQVDGQRGLTATCLIEGAPYDVPAVVAHALVQITREALSNVVKHAAAARVTVHLAYEEEALTLTIADDGRGFDPEAPRDGRHLGLRNLRLRADDVSGTFTVHSAPGHGTTIVVRVAVHNAVGQ